MRKTLSPFSMQFLAKLLTRERLTLKSPSLTGMIKDIQAIINARAEAYNCSFSVAIKTPGIDTTLSLASPGVSTDTKFAWGSITKMWTGASIMQLVAKKQATLNLLLLYVHRQ